MRIGQSSENIHEVLPLLASEANKTALQAPKTNIISNQPPSRVFSLFKKFNLLPMRNLDVSSETDENNEIEQGDVIEIEVPVIGSDFTISEKHHSYDNKVETDDAANILKSNYIEWKFTATQSYPDISQTEMGTEDFSTFQTSDDETTFKSGLDTTTQPASETSSESFIDKKHRKYFTEDIRSAESELMKQRKAADEMIDGSFESKIFTLKTQRRSKHPFNVKIIVNNEVERKSCKTKSSCSQVSFSRSRDYGDDPQIYFDYSDEDLLLKNEPERYFERPNGLRARNARRAADDMPITPAPRFKPIRGIKKPSFIEHLENESSLERSERINKNLDGFMRFVSVWAQIDKFVADRARGAVKKLAHLSGDDYADDFTLGTKRRVDSKRTVHDPFT